MELGSFPQVTGRGENQKNYLKPPPSLLNPYFCVGGGGYVGGGYRRASGRSSILLMPWPLIAKTWSYLRFLPLGSVEVGGWEKKHMMRKDLPLAGDSLDKNTSWFLIYLYIIRYLNLYISWIKYMKQKQCRLYEYGYQTSKISIGDRGSCKDSNRTEAIYLQFQAPNSLIHVHHHRVQGQQTSAYILMRLFQCDICFQVTCVVDCTLDVAPVRQNIRVLQGSSGSRFNVDWKLNISNINISTVW